MVSQESLDVIRRGKEIYDVKLRQKLETNHLNKFVAIEPDSGNYYLGDTLSTAIQAARAAHPDRIPYAHRIGHQAAVHLGVMAT